MDPTRPVRGCVAWCGRWWWRDGPSSGPRSAKRLQHLGSGKPGLLRSCRITSRLNTLLEHRKAPPMPLDAARPNKSLNVLGGVLETCSLDPLTGFTRSGCCETGPDDLGSHTVCAEVTAEFLQFSKSRGNDLSTPRPEYRFPGLQPGDRWCLCAMRWQEAFLAGCAPRVALRATEAAALAHCRLEDLQAHAVG